MIRLQNVSKKFKSPLKEPGLKGSIKNLFFRKYKEKMALEDVSFELQQGEIVGLIGANGAGKTTLVKILSGIIHPSNGSVSVIGFNPWERSDLYRKQMSVIMGQKSQVWWDLPALDSFLLLKEIYQIPQDIYQKNLDFLTEALRMKDHLKTQVRRLSLGERMKVELIAALLHQPKVIFLDEPTIGLDISAQKAVREFIKNYQQEFKPITILTSHYMEDIKELCPRIIILSSGKKIYDGDLDKIESTFSDKKNITAVHDGKLIKETISKETLPSYLEGLIKSGQITDVTIQNPSIEDIIEELMLRGTK